MLTPLGFFSAGDSAGTFELISTQTLSGTTAAVTFTSIPQTYKHLQVRFSAMSGNSSEHLFVKVNASASGYYNHTLAGENNLTSVYAADNYSSMFMVASCARNNGSSIYSSGILDIVDYTSTIKNKQFKLFSGKTVSPLYSLAASASIQFVSSLYTSTSAVSSLEFTNLGSFAAGTRFSLYGIKG